MSLSEIEIRRLSSCSFDEAHRLWNEGFQGYQVDLTLTLDGYLARLHAEGISPELSLAAFVGGVPAGFVLNGVRAHAGRKVAWNGGTGVAPAFRGRGVGRALIKAAFAVYREHSVEEAALEAISDNRPAIALYRRFGYEVIDQLFVLRHEGPLAVDAFGTGGDAAFSAKRVAPYEVNALSFYTNATPWQTQWQSVHNAGGAALVILDAAGAEAGYALYKNRLDERGQVQAVVLCQCQPRPGLVNAAAVVGRALRETFAPLGASCLRLAHNLSATNEAALSILATAGFAVAFEQVHMCAQVSDSPARF
jgi:ribosomal protein S18 acetylase RimI-like enzyme